MAPVSGAIFCLRAAGFTNVCDKSARTAIQGNNGFASWHIAYKNASQRSQRIIKGVFWGTALRYGDRRPDLGWNTGASRDFPLLCMTNAQLAERSGCRADGALLQFQLAIDRRRQPPRQ